MKKLHLLSVLALTAFFFFTETSGISAHQTKTPQTQSKTFRRGNRLFHITPAGDTIVSSLDGQKGNFFEKLNKEVQAKSDTANNGLPGDPLNPMYGLNMYIPAHDTDYVSNLDFYGSGDVNGDGVINMEDYNSTVYSTHAYYDGTYRGDVNMDRIAGDAGDKKIILEYIQGKIDEVNVWELETPAQKLEHFKKALAIDPTDKVNATTSGWVCYNYSGQLFLNFNGIHDVKNSFFAGNNGTNVQYDINHTGIFRIPMRDVSDWTSDGIAHSINMVYIGGPKQQDAGEFSYQVYVEPQTDIIQKVGDYSLARSVQVKWYSYAYNNLFHEWGYGSSDLIDYNLNQDKTVTQTWINQYLVKAWNPMEKVKYPTDKVLEYPADTSAQANGVPANLYGIWARVKHTDSTTQTHGGTKSDVDYLITRKWEITEGAYNPTNTPDAVHEQKIKVEDTIPPTYDTGENGPVNVKDNSGLPVTITTDTISTQGSDTTQCDHYSYTESVKYIMTDVAGNTSAYEKVLKKTEDKPPYLVSSPVPYNDTIFVAAGSSISPDSLPNGWATWKDPENGPITKLYADTLLVKTALYAIWHRVETAAGAKAVVYPNPATGSFTLRYSTLREQELKVVLYNLQGQALQEKHRRVHPGKNQIPFRLTTPGMYFLKIETGNGPVEVVKLRVAR